MFGELELWPASDYSSWIVDEDQTNILFSLNNVKSFELLDWKGFSTFKWTLMYKDFSSEMEIEVERGFT